MDPDLDLHVTLFSSKGLEALKTNVLNGLLGLIRYAQFCKLF